MSLQLNASRYSVSIWNRLSQKQYVTAVPSYDQDQKESQTTPKAAALETCLAYLFV